MFEFEKEVEVKSDNPIIPAPTAIETFRDAGYKNTASALAELIDNAIEAEAENIQILTFEEPVALSKRTVHRIISIAVYDDGVGMTPQTLQLALQFGMGTRLKSRKGIGRFGIGLPNASISQCRRIEVFSWQESICYYTYLDIDEVKENSQQFSNPVQKCELPHKYLSCLEGISPKSSGTLVVWSKCDRLDISKSISLYNSMERDLCRIYRHFLDNDNSYGNRVSINLVSNGKEKKCLKLKANDPIYLLTPNNVPGFENQSTNLLHGNVIRIPVEYNDEGDTSEVEMRFSIALPETQNLGGNSQVGQHYARNTGISLVRACREIDFGDFGFFNPRDERQRWWGCEIRFEPVLDELFGVTNNKQSCRGFKFIDVKEFQNEHGDFWEDELKNDRRFSLLFEISKAFSGNHRKVIDTIISRGKGKKGLCEGEFIDKATKVANDQLADSNEPTKSKQIGEQKKKEEKTQEWLESLKNANIELSEEELKQVAEEKADLNIAFDFSTWPGEQFFTLETRGGTVVVVINMKHPFYTDLYEPLTQDKDSKLSDAIDLLLMAYARCEDEMYSYEEELQDLRSKWGHYVQKFLRALKKEA